MVRVGVEEHLLGGAGQLSDPNLEPSVLAMRTSIGAGAKVYKPSVEAIWERYFAKFSKAGKLEEDDDDCFGLAPAPAPTPAPAPAPVPGPAPAPAQV